MKICWDNLENMRLTKNGNFIFKGSLYMEKDSCAYCGETFLALKHKEQAYCCKDCGHKNVVFSEEHKNNIRLSKQYTSDETRKRMSDTAKLKKLTDIHKANIGKHNKGKLNYFYKGGVKKKKLPLYDTYAERIVWMEDVRPYINSDGLKLLQVKCTKCKEWFVPKLDNVKDRIRFIDGKRTAESRFYCSDGCKDTCPIYWKVKYPDGHNPRKYKNGIRSYTNAELSIWSQEVLSRANYICEICGGSAEHAHHIQPKKLEPFFALDPENGLALCKKCHYERGHMDVCSTGNLANMECE